MNSKVILKWVKLEGFGSIVHQISFDLNRKGLNIIRGDNGVGKTTVFSGLCWALGGEPLKKNSTILTWPKKRNQDFKGTRVSVGFKKDGKTYIVHRHKEYKGKTLGFTGKNRLILEENEKERNDLKDQKDVQKEINRILGFSPLLFRNSVVFGQKLKRIIEEAGPLQKRVFDEAFEVEYLNKAKDLADRQKTDKLKEQSEISNKLGNLNAKLSELEDRYKHEKALKLEYTNKRDSKLEALETEIRDSQYKRDKNLNQYKIKSQELISNKTKVEMDIAKFTELISIITKDSNEHFKSTLRLSSLEGEYEDNRKDLVAIRTQYKEIREICPECSQPIPPNKIKQARINLKNKRNKIKAHLEILNQKIDGLKDSISILAKRVDKENEYKMNLTLAKSELARISKTNNSLEDLKVEARSLDLMISDKYRQIEALHREKLKFNLKSLKKKIKKFKADIKPLVSEEEKLNKEIGLYEWLIKEPLSNSGIKAYVFNQMLALLNKQLEEYQEIMGFEVRFGIDLSSRYKDFYCTVMFENEPVLYEDLSGGEKQLVDVFIAFAIHDVVTLEKNINVLLLDEVFESLDIKNIEKISQFIAFKAQTKCLYLITHNDNFITSGDYNMISIATNNKKQTLVV